jgi:O-antigen ligase
VAVSVEGDSPPSWSTRLIVAGLVLGVLSGHSHRLGFPIGPDRLLIAAGLGLLFATGQFRHAGRLRWRAVHTLMLATVGWATWSALAHQTLSTEYGAYALLDRLVVPFVLFVLAPVVFPRPQDRGLLLKALIGLALYLSVTAVFEVLGPQSLVFPSYILDPDVGILFGRARGPAVSPEANGMIMGAALFWAWLVGLAHLRGPWRVAAIVLIPLATVGMLLTLTRSIWLGTALGTVAVAVLNPVSRRRLPVIAGGALALVGGLLLTVPALSDLVVDRLTTERSVFDRQNTNAAALRMVAEHPIDGVGWVRYLDLSVDWVRQSDSYPITSVEIEVHNVVLSRAAELGLVGAALWVGCVLAGPGLAVLNRPSDRELQSWRLAFIAFALMWGVTIMVSPVPYPLPNNLLWLSAGIILRDYLMSSRGGNTLSPSTAQAASHDPN